MSRKLGQAYERQALSYLTQQGLRLIQCNFNCKLGEIDLIMQDKLQLVFVEVRYRSQLSHGSALESITASKQQKLIKTAEYFLLTHSQYQHCPSRFDVISLQPSGITWLPNAFQA